jgi:NADP-dependent 3-hydroxy acid dehydrogenase YdfG
MAGTAKGPEAGKKVVVITGASAGIGAALARRLAPEGNAVVLAARRERELREVADSLGERALAVPTDVTRRAEVERLRDRALEAFGRVHVWVNNAGRGIDRPVLELTDEDLDEMMTVNVKSALYGMQAIVPHFIAREGGQLINVSSFLGRVPLATHRSAYNAAKAALNALTANLRTDLRVSHPKIHVSLVMPGLVATEFARNALGGGRSHAPPAGAMRPQSPEEVADRIAALITEPVAEIYTNPASAGLARKYFEDVEAFERGI